MLAIPDSIHNLAVIFHVLCFAQFNEIAIKAPPEDSLLTAIAPDGQVLSLDSYHSGTGS